METSNIVEFASRVGISDGLTDLLRTGAQQLIATAVEAELENFLVPFIYHCARKRVTRLLSNLANGRGSRSSSELSD